MKREQLKGHLDAVTAAMARPAPPAGPCDALSPKVPSVQQALATLSDAMQVLGIDESTASNLAQYFAIAITQAQAKAAMRSENTK